VQTELRVHADPTERWLGPMYFQHPGSERVAMVTAQMASAPFSYGPVGGTRDVLPVGWQHDVVKRSIGEGDAAWERAVAALRQWSQFDLSWVEPHDPTVPLAPGATFAFVSRQLGLWSLNVCRVVYTIDDEVEGVRRFGFAYGTVGSHVVKGEERFLLEYLPSGQVQFSISKFSLPAHPVVRMAGPLARRIQRRFSEDALDRMAQEVSP